MKKIFLIWLPVIVAIGFVSCTPSFSLKTIEGYWWHSWGHDGLDYVHIKSDGKCDCDFGTGKPYKDLSISIDNKAQTITIYGIDGEDKVFMYDQNEDMLTESENGYAMWRISEEDLQANLNLPPVIIEEEEYGYSDDEEEIIFRSASDVMNYLSRVSFSDGEFTLRFKYDGLYANGRLLTGAIVVEDYDEVGAILSCYSPYGGSHLRFKLVSEMLVKNLNTGEIYYINK